MAGIALLAFVIAQRLAELVYANANTKKLLAAGAVEHKAAHYGLIVAVHVTWLATLLWLAPGREIFTVFLVVYLLLQVFRAWVFAGPPGLSPYRAKPSSPKAPTNTSATPTIWS